MPNLDPLRASTPLELAADYQQQVEELHAFRGPVVGRELHQAFWGREIKAQLRKVYGWPL